MLFTPEYRSRLLYAVLCLLFVWTRYAQKGHLMFCSVSSCTVTGLETNLISVEVDVSCGLPCFQMVGALSNEVRESKDRVRVALKNSGFALPAMCINVNLSPADIRKEGTAFDLPLAIGVLVALGNIEPTTLDNTLVIGELGLNGEVKPVRGVLPIVRKARDLGFDTIILPSANSKEGGLIPGINIVAVEDLMQTFLYLSADVADQINSPCLQRHSAITDITLAAPINVPDFADVHGQELVKRSAIVAAAGFHHMLMVGPPGAGKTMIAKRIPGILPPLTMDEALEVTSIYSVAGLLDNENSLISTRPFLSPHHTITDHALAGGGHIPRPGVISLAHRGVLFLDEMTEFKRSTLDIMRQPIEDHYVHIARSHGTYKYPAEFMLVAACNPCPCGFYPDRNKCKCSDPMVKRYIGRISGPLLDRIDICCSIEAIGLDALSNDSSKNNLSSAQMREKVMIARTRQEHRFKGSNISFNSEMSPAEISSFCQLGSNEELMIKAAYDSLGLSARSYHRILRCARTIADIDDSESISEIHLSEAIMYRTSGERYWGR